MTRSRHRSRRRWGIAVLVLALAGCGLLDPCEEDRRIYEVEFGPLEDLQYLQVKRAREDGYKCTSESIRNAFGNRIGTRYECTKCE